MKRFFHLILCFLAVSLTACASNTVMPSIKASETLSTQSSKSAVLSWQSGTVIASDKVSYVSGDSVGELLVGSLVDAQMRKSHPSLYTFSYGKAEQAVFMTSLRDTLQEQKAFKKISLSEESKIPAQDVLILVNFKETKVLAPSTNYQIVLNVDLVMKQANKTVYQHNYVVKSKRNGFFSLKNFNDQEKDVSEQLLNQIIQGISQGMKKLSAA